MKQAGKFDTTLIPTEVGERVRIVGFGGKVNSSDVDRTGVVFRFTKAGNPVIRFDGFDTNNPSRNGTIDRYDCARVIDTDGKLVRPDALPVHNDLDGKSTEQIIEDILRLAGALSADKPFAVTMTNDTLRIDLKEARS